MAENKTDRVPALKSLGFLWGQQTDKNTQDKMISSQIRVVKRLSRVARWRGTGYMSAVLSRVARAGL